jgi:hypothetical protein
MPGDPGFRANQNFAQSTQKSWIRRYGGSGPNAGDGGSSIHNYTFGQDIGIDTTLRRWPLNPIDKARFLVFRNTTTGEVWKITGDANYREYAGISRNPQFDGKAEQVWEKDGKAMLPVGHEDVEIRDFLMPDIDSAFGTEDQDVIPQVATKQFTFPAATAITAAVDNVAGYAIGTTVLQIDTISVGFALTKGATISITTGGQARYYLIKSIDYTQPTAAGTDALVTLAWGLSFAVVNNDVITTAHAADAPIYFPWDSEFFGMLKEIERAVQQDADGGGAGVTDADVLPIVAFAAGGIANTTIAIVPAGNSTDPFTHTGTARGGIGIQLGDALATGDVLFLTAKFYDRIIRTFTIGKAGSAGAARTGTDEGEFSEIKVELKC